MAIDTCGNRRRVKGQSHASPSSSKCSLIHAESMNESNDKRGTFTKSLWNRKQENHHGHGSLSLEIIIREVS